MRVRIYCCTCGYRSLQKGKCRSHPYPLRGMGPDMGEPVEFMPVSEYNGIEDAVVALEDISGSPYEPSAEDARGALRRLEKRGKL